MANLHPTFLIGLEDPATKIVHIAREYDPDGIRVAIDALLTR